MPQRENEIWGTCQFLKDTAVELPFRGSALPELLVVVLETAPVSPEFLEAGFIDILDPIQRVSVKI